MSEITKLYENAEVEKFCNSNSEFCPVESCDECNFNIYPPFTAEKQIELIKKISPSYHLNYHIKCFQGYSFEEGLAKCINNLWECLSEEEKQQVKGILEWVNTNME